MITFKNEFDEPCQKAFASDSKIGLLCTVAPDGYPHITLISSISVKDRKTMMWGQFCQGLSKIYTNDNPKTGFLVVSPDQHWWTGKALYTGSTVKGEDYDYFNNKPIFHYNSYFGFGAVHYEDLIDLSTVEKLPLLKIGIGYLITGLLKKKSSELKTDTNIYPGNSAKMPPYGKNLANTLACLKFVAYIDTDGYPRLFPVMQGQEENDNTLIFSPTPYGDLLKHIPKGAKTAIYLANMDLESLLLEGRWNNTEKNGHLKHCRFEIDRIYNPMPPLTGYIYPPRILPNVYGV